MICLKTLTSFFPFFLPSTLEVESGFPPVRIWYGQSVYWKIRPCTVRTKPKTA
jgi:hypothetical protein